MSPAQRRQDPVFRSFNPNQMSYEKLNNWHGVRSKLVWKWGTRPAVETEQYFSINDRADAPAFRRSRVEHENRARSVERGSEGKGRANGDGEKEKVAA